MKKAVKSIKEDQSLRSAGNSLDIGTIIFQRHLKLGDRIKKSVN